MPRRHWLGPAEQAIGNGCTPGTFPHWYFLILPIVRLEVLVVVDLPNRFLQHGFFLHLLGGLVGRLNFLSLGPFGLFAKLQLGIGLALRQANHPISKKGAKGLLLSVVLRENVRHVLLPVHLTEAPG